MLQFTKLPSWLQEHIWPKFHLSPTDKSQGSNSSSLSTRINRQEEITDLGKKKILQFKETEPY